MQILNPRLFALCCVLLITTILATIGVAQDKRSTDETGQVNSWLQSESNKDGKI